MKITIIYIWKKIQWCTLFIYYFKTKISNRIKIYYGGAIAGDTGGPLVKLKRLKKIFPQSFFNFNVVYLLSNAIYTPFELIAFLKRKNVPVILNQNGVFYSGWYSGDWEKKNNEMSLFYHEANYVFWQSKFCKLSADKFLGKRRGPGEILYNCIDTNFFVPSSKIVRDNNFKFLITGKINQSLEYRITETLRGISYANKKGYNFQLIIAGKIDKIVIKNCINLAKSLKILNALKILGRYSQKIAPLVYQQAHAYVMLKYKDPCPNSVIEAMSCGLPILYSNSGGLPELVNNRCGVALSVKESWTEKRITPKYDEIGNGMIKIYKRHKSMSSNARKRAVSKFDLKFWYDRHNAVFKDYLFKC